MTDRAPGIIPTYRPRDRGHGPRHATAWAPEARVAGLPAVNGLRHLVGAAPPERPPIRLLLAQVRPEPVSSRCDDVVQRFLADADLYALPVVDPVLHPFALVHRYTFVEFFSRPYVREVHGRKPIGQFLANKPDELQHQPPIVVDEATSIDDVAGLIAEAGAQHMLGGFIVTRAGRYAGIANGYQLLQDITRRKHAELHYLAHYDQLTGLANRMLFNDRLAQACRQADRHRGAVGVLFVDLDHFKQINDSLGHGAGDALLRLVAERMLGCVRHCDTVARLGGDEFAILMDTPERPADVSMLARRIVEAVREPFPLAGRRLFVTASIGIALYPRDDTDVSRLFAKADAALYDIKAGGRDGFREYAPGLARYNPDRVSLDSDLRCALKDGEFVLHYQPQACLATGRVVGLEALIRWQHAQRGLLAPAHFIAAAEESGLIADIGAWVIQTACAQLRSWQDQGFAGVAVAVNVSARQFQSGDLASTVAAALTACGLQPRFLELELTESAVMADPEATIAILDELKQIGVRIALDDFGTGYSSLGYLKRFPIDRLKIDRSFVRDVTTDPDDAAIARMVIALAHTLKQRVVAEGVETQAQAAFLHREHCDEIQGYLYSRPLPAEAVPAFLHHAPRLPLAAARPDVRRTVLTVDDDPGVTLALKRLLRGQGYRVLSAGSAAEALQLLALHEVQVVLSGQNMPEMSGTDFLNRVWQAYPQTARILLTACTDFRCVADAVNRAAILKFLAKPWDDESLMEHVRDAFRCHDQQPLRRPM